MPDESPEVKAVVQFATTAARKGATPKAIKIAYRTIIFLQGLFGLIEPEFHIPQQISYTILRWSALSITIIYFICIQFGWTKPSSTTDQTTEV